MEKINKPLVNTIFNTVKRYCSFTILNPGLMDANYNEIFMQRAVALSEIAYQTGKGLPIGCVVVKNGVIVGEGHNEIFARINPTAHGEMVAIENACKNTGNLQLSDCDLYTTLEPCPMCFGAIYWAKVRTVYYANNAGDASEVGFDDSFIFKQLVKPKEEQIIPMINVKFALAKKVLADWKLKELNASQPWA